MTTILEPPTERADELVVPTETSRSRAILDLPEVRRHIASISVIAYEALGSAGFLNKQVELIRGVILTKMAKSPLHRKINKLIYDTFSSHRIEGHVIFQESPLRLIDSEPEPDVMIVRGEVSDFDSRHPTAAALVVEVAVSSVALDRENASLYAEAGVTEYWIVLGTERQIEVYRQPEQGIYQQKRLYAVVETLACESVPGLQVKLADWFA